MPNRIDTAVHSKIEAALRAGVRPMQILAETGVSRSMVYKVAYDNGIVIKRPKDTSANDAKRAAHREQMEVLRLRNEEIIALFNRGETLEAIAQQYGVTRERIRQIAHKAGGKPRRVVKAEQMEATRAILSSGPMTPEQASDALGLDRAETLRIARSFGIELVVKRAWDNPEVAALAELVRGGKSIRSVARGDLKMTRWLSEYCDHYGITLRYGRWASRRERPAHIPSGFRSKPSRVQRSRVPAVIEAARASYGKESAAAVAARCGVTRNTIIGYWFRLRKKGEL